MEKSEKLPELSSLPIGQSLIWRAVINKCNHRKERNKTANNPATPSGFYTICKSAGLITTDKIMYCYLAYNWEDRIAVKGKT